MILMSHAQSNISTMQPNRAIYLEHIGYFSDKHSESLHLLFSAHHVKLGVGLVSEKTRGVGAEGPGVHRPLDRRRGCSMELMTKRQRNIRGVR